MLFCLRIHRQVYINVNYLINKIYYLFNINHCKNIILEKKNESKIFPVSIVNKAFLST